MPRNMILVVEDDIFLRIEAVSMLSESGADVIEMEAADEALAYLGEHADEVAAVFTDVATPGGLNGLQLARSIISTWPDIKVLVTSGYMAPPLDLPENVRFIPKPWLPLDVLAAVGTVADALIV